MIGELIYTRLEAQHSPTCRPGYQVAYCVGLSDADVRALGPLYSAWSPGDAPVRSMALPDGRIAVCQLREPRACGLVQKVMNASLRRGLYIAHVRVYPPPRWTPVENVQQIVEAAMPRR